MNESGKFRQILTNVGSSRTFFKLFSALDLFDHEVLLLQLLLTFDKHIRRQDRSDDTGALSGEWRELLGGQIHIAAVVSDGVGGRLLRLLEQHALVARHDQRAVQHLSFSEEAIQSGGDHLILHRWDVGTGRA